MPIRIGQSMLPLVYHLAEFVPADCYHVVQIHACSRVKCFYDPISDKYAQQYILLDRIGDMLHNMCYRAYKDGFMESARTVPEIARIIKATRKQQGIRQQDLADLSGVSCRFLSDLENGKASVELGKVLAVLATLGLEPLLRPRSSKVGHDGY